MTTSALPLHRLLVLLPLPPPTRYILTVHFVVPLIRISISILGGVCILSTMRHPWSRIESEYKFSYSPKLKLSTHYTFCIYKKIYIFFVCRMCTMPSTSINKSKLIVAHTMLYDSLSFDIKLFPISSPCHTNCICSEKTKHLMLCFNHRLVLSPFACYRHSNIT